MDELIKSPEKKIKNSAKLLDSISSKLEKSSNELATKLSTVRNLESINDNLSFSLLDLERKSKQETVAAVRGQAQARSATSPTAGEETDTFAKSSFAVAAAAAMAANIQPTLSEGDTTVPMISEGGVSPDSYVFSGFKTSNRPGHKGIDISGGPFAMGNPFSVIQPGVVHYVGRNTDGGFGNYVIIKHDNGLYSLYGHMEKIYVKKGDPVGKSGESTVIGTVGSTGKSEGPHIHFELAPRESGNYLNGQFDPTSSAKYYIRGGGIVKTRPQNQPTSSVTPQTRPAASPTQVTPSPQPKPQPRAQQLNNTQAVAQTPQQNQQSNIIKQVSDFASALKLNQALNTR